MTGCYAILVDGGFVKYQLGTAKAPMDAAKVADFVQRVGQLPALTGLRLHRVYFYDAKPLAGTCANPIDASTIDFGASDTASRNKSLHAALARAPFFSLRFGELFQEGWRLKSKVLRRKTAANHTLAANDIQPNIRQKGVDMRIGLDIASLTLKKQAQVIVLATGDSDFIPAMKFARREGAQLILITLGHGVKDGMHEHADLVIDTLP